jgi:aryl-alcohol dehydrogenase-like predicted oxidoreductase
MKRRKFMKVAAITAAAGGLISPVLGSEWTKRSRPMPKQVLGKTGVEVSLLALGGVIGMKLPPSETHDPVAIAETALDLGISYFDTAPGYNNGQSEANFGHVLARRRKEVFLACKTADRSYDGTMRSVEQSLKRLQIDHFDLLQIHGITSEDDPGAWEKPDGVLTALRKLQDQKVTRFIGITGHDDAGVLRQAIEMYDFDTLLAALNPTGNRKPFREELLPAANRKKMGVIAMKVMGGGNGCLVVGNPFKDLILPYHDETSHQVPAESLIRYALGLPVSVAVIGVDSIEELKANVEAVKEGKFMTALQQQELERIIG